MPRMTAEYKKRLERHYDELKWLFCELYGENTAAFTKLLDSMQEYYSARKTDLKKLDRTREAEPGWYQKNDMLGMMMYTDCFAGTLQGVREKLPYIKECGTTCLHLMPLLESPAGRSDGGYAVSDYRRVNPKLGTMEDLAELADDCHKDGISVCMDFVMNHTSEDHEWAKRARAGEKEFMDRYFFFDSWDIPNEYEKTVPQVFPTTAPGNFTLLDDCGKIVMTFFYPYQWDLNYSNPDVFIDMTGNMLNIANHGVDVIRIDAVPYIWKQLYTDCRNLPQVHTIVRMVRMICEIVCPGVLLLGEVVMEPVKVAPYFGTVTKPECHMLYNATMMCTVWSTVATRDVRLLKHQLDVMASLPSSYTWLNYIRCHDDIGWGLDYDYLRNFAQQEVAHKRYITDYFTGRIGWSDSRGETYNDDPVTGDSRLCGTAASLCGIEKGLAEHNDGALKNGLACDIMLHAFVMTQSGMPMLYSGDEIGRLNDYSYHDNPEKAEDSRYLHRGAFQWDEAEKRGTPGTVPYTIFNSLRKIEKVRAEHEVFSSDAGFYTIWTGTENVLGLVREKGGEKLVALFNFSEHAHTLSVFDHGAYTDLLSGEAADISSVSLEPYGFRWLLSE